MCASPQETGHPAQRGLLGRLAGSARRQQGQGEGGAQLGECLGSDACDVDFWEASSGEVPLIVEHTGVGQNRSPNSEEGLSRTNRPNLPHKALNLTNIGATNNT